MTTSLYTVTLTDLGSYTVTVAADSTKDAGKLAETILHTEATALPPGLRIDKRDVEAVAAVADAQPIRQFRMYATYSIDFWITVPASSRDEAERHAKRIYDLNPFVHDHEVRDERVRWEYAEEVQS
jgi:hypothetical protein